MFELPGERSLFQNKYALYPDSVRGGYWAIYKNGVCYIKPPTYDFQWFKISDKEFKELFPKHYKCFEHHKFLFGVENESLDANKECRR